MEAVAVDLSGVALVQIAGGIGARSEGSLDAGCPTYRWFCGHLSSCCGPNAPPGGARKASVGSPWAGDDPRTRVAGCPAGDAAESLGREHQARGRTRPQQGWFALLRARV